MDSQKKILLHNVTGYIQARRGLTIAAVSLGSYGSVIALFGMKCTKVGGLEKARAKIACLAGIVSILSGLCSMTGCSLDANKITTEFFECLFVDQKYELGAALFIGWLGASLCMIGGVTLAYLTTKHPECDTCTTRPHLSCLHGQSITVEEMLQL